MGDAMSLVFVPNIPAAFKHKIRKKGSKGLPTPFPHLKWPNSELDLLIELRALRASFVDCGCS